MSLAAAATAAAAAKMELLIHISIPIRGSSERVVLSADDLANNLDEILSLLESEVCPLEIWYQVAIECYRRGHVESFVSVLESANSDDIDEIAEYQSQVWMRVKICTSLAAYHVSQGLKVPGSHQSEFSKAELLLEKAEILAKSNSVTTTAGGSSGRDGFSRALIAGRVNAIPLSEHPTSISGPKLSNGSSQTNPSTTTTTTSSSKNGIVGTEHVRANSSGDSAADRRRPQRDHPNPSLQVWIGKGFLYLAECSVSRDNLIRTQKLYKAASVFSLVSNLQTDNAQAKLGQAAVQMISRNYRDALQLYAEVLAAHPTRCPANVRFCIGLCFFHLRSFERSREAFERTLQLQPDSIEALCCLAYLQSCDQKGALRSLELTRRAALSDPSHPLVLLRVADSAFYADRHEEAESLLQFVMANSTSPKILCQASYQIGRQKHLRGDFSEAYHDYAACLRELPTHFAARFGYAQCALFLNKPREAIENLQNLNRVCPKNADILKLLSYSCSVVADELMSAAKLPRIVTGTLPDSSFRSESQRSTKTEDVEAKQKTLAEAEKFCATALECINEFIAAAPNDIEALLVKIRICEMEIQRGNTSLHNSAMASYKKLVELASSDTATSKDDKTSPKSGRHVSPKTTQTQDKGGGIDKQLLLHEAVPIEFVNNIGVLQLLSPSEAAKRAAEETFKAALTRLETDKRRLTHVEDELRAKCAGVTIRYNAALQAEMVGKWSVAHERYKTLTVECPNLPEPWLRRASTALERSEFGAARKYCEAAMKYAPESRDAHALLSEVFRASGKREQSIGQTAKIIKSPAGAADSYSFTLYGSCLYQNAVEKGQLSSDASTQISKYFSAALRRDPSNWAAANGLAVLLAERNFVDPASEIFRMVLEASANSPSAASKPYLESVLNVNAGLLQTAIAMTANNVRPGEDVQKIDGQKVNKAIKHYQNALKVDPMNEACHRYLSRLYWDACRFRDCQKLLEEAMVQWPHDVRIRHNFALAVEQAIYREMRVEAYVKDPEKVRQWISECKVVGQIHASNSELKSMWPDLEKVDRSVLARVRSGVESFSALGGPLCSSEFATAPPAGLEDLPSHDKLKSLLNRTSTNLLEKLTHVLPMVVRSWEKRREEMESFRMKNEELRRQHEEMLKQQEEKRKLDEARRQRLAESLNAVTATLADEIPAFGRVVEAQKQRKGNRRTAEDFINDNDDEQQSDDDMEDADRGRRRRHKTFDDREHTEKSSKKRGSKKHRSKKKHRRSGHHDDDLDADGDRKEKSSKSSRRQKEKDKSEKRKKRKHSSSKHHKTESGDEKDKKRRKHRSGKKRHRTRDGKDDEEERDGGGGSGAAAGGSDDLFGEEAPRLSKKLRRDDGVEHSDEIDNQSDTTGVTIPTEGGMPDELLIPTAAVDGNDTADDDDEIATPPQ